MVCSSCGSNNPENNRFCGQCGARLAASAIGPVEPAETEIVPAGPVSSAFRQEVEQQQYQLKRLQRRAEDRGAQSDPTAMPEFGRRTNDRRVVPESGTEAMPETTRWGSSEDAEATEWQPPSNSGDETIVTDGSNGDRGAYRSSRAPFASETEVIDTGAVSGATRADSGHEEAPISGPSFLGLGEPERDPKSNLSYLYEDEPRSGRARYWIAALIVIACAAFFFYEWKQNWNWDTTIIGRHKAQQADSGKPGGEASQETKNNADTQAAPADSAANSAGQGAAASNSAPAVQSDNSAGAETGASPNPAPGDKSAAASAAPEPAAGPEQSQTASQQGQSPKSAAGQTDAAQNGETAEQATRAAGSQSTEQQSANAGDEDISEDDTGRSGDAVAEATPTRRSKRGPAKPVAGRYAEKEPGSELVAKGEKYLYGRGVPKNCDQALVYLRTAANRGNADARSKLGALYATGHCVSMDRAEAYNWFTLAREAGSKNMWVERNREMLWSQMSQAEKERTLGP